jgi:hypothetical protein
VTVGLVNHSGSSQGGFCGSWESCRPASLRRVMWWVSAPTSAGDAGEVSDRGMYMSRVPRTWTARPVADRSARGARAGHRIRRFRSVAAATGRRGGSGPVADASFRPCRPPTASSGLCASWQGGRGVRMMVLDQIRLRQRIGAAVVPRRSRDRPSTSARLVLTCRVHRYLCPAVVGTLHSVDRPSSGARP